MNVHVDLSGGSGPPAICGPSPYDTPSFPQPAIADSGRGLSLAPSGSPKKNNFCSEAFDGEQFVLHFVSCVVNFIFLGIRIT